MKFTLVGWRILDNDERNLRFYNYFQGPASRELLHTFHPVCTHYHQVGILLIYEFGDRCKNTSFYNEP